MLYVMFIKQYSIIIQLYIAVIRNKHNSTQSNSNNNVNVDALLYTITCNVYT